MNQRIIYPTPEGGVSVIIPAPECGLTVEEIAVKDVPAGVPYNIIDASDVPSNRALRCAWESDFTAPDGYGVGHGVWFAQNGGSQ